MADKKQRNSGHGRRDPEPASQSKGGTSPYNFVSLPEEPYFLPKEEADLVRGGLHGRLHADRHHGVIHLTLETITPVYTRGPIALDRNDVSAAKDNPDFYHYGDPKNRPVIPGSSIRGMIRSVFEIASKAAFQPGRDLSGEMIIHREVGGGKGGTAGSKYRQRIAPQTANGIEYPSGLVRAGYLERGKNGQMQIQPATTYHGRSFLQVAVKKLEALDMDTEKLSRERDCSKDIWVKIPDSPSEIHSLKLLVWEAPEVSLTDPGTPGWVKGRLVFTGKAPSKRRWQYVFFSSDTTDQNKPIPVSMDIWEAFKKDSKSGRAVDDRVVDTASGGVPVFYLVRREGSSEVLEFIGTSMMMRLPYPKRPKDLIPQRMKNEDASQLDLVDALFGTVVGTPIRGRLSFSDAVWVETEGTPYVYPHPVVPFILNGPKPSAYQMYLEQKAGRSVTTYYDSDARLRGRKVYWHKPKVQNTDMFAKVNGKLAATETHMLPVKKGQLFKTKIRFHNLSDIELGCLLWILQLSPSKYAFRIGMGKPLGLGSVKAEHTLTLIDPKERYVRWSSSGGSLEDGRISDEEQVQTLASRSIDAFKKAVSSGKFEEELPIKELLTVLRYDETPDLEDISYVCIDETQWGKRTKSSVLSQSADVQSRNFSFEGKKRHWKDRCQLRGILPPQERNGQTSPSARSSVGQQQAQSTPPPGPWAKIVPSGSQKVGESQKKVASFRRQQTVTSTVAEAKPKVKIRIEGHNELVSADWHGTALEVGQTVRATILEVSPDGSRIKKVKISTIR